jgi:hypothetical protein
MEAGSTISRNCARGWGGASEVRLLFVFDAAREAIILVAGEKAGRWGGWYAEAIPLAEERYAVYQRENGEKEL